MLITAEQKRRAIPPENIEFSSPAIFPFCSKYFSLLDFILYIIYAKLPSLHRMCVGRTSEREFFTYINFLYFFPSSSLSFRPHTRAGSRAYPRAPFRKFRIFPKFPLHLLSTRTHSKMVLLLVFIRIFARFFFA